MKKFKLLVLPLVAIMTACNKAPAQPTADLPSGGEEVAYSKDDKTAQKAYGDSLVEFAKSALNTINLDLIQIDASAKGSMKGIPTGENRKSDANFEAAVSVYLAAPSTETAYLKVEIKNITATVTNVIPGENEGEYQDLKLENLKITIDIEDTADTTTYAYIDLSDKSIENALTPFMGTSTSTMLDSMLGTNRKVYANVSTLIGQYSSLIFGLMPTSGRVDGDVEPEPKVEPISSVITTIIALARLGVAGVIGQISTIDLSQVNAKLLPTIKNYKDNAGKLQRIGLQGTYNLVELIEEFGSSEAALPAAAETEPTEGENIPELKSGRVSASALVGNTHGSETFAFEEAHAYVDFELVEGLSGSCEANVNAKYNSQANLVRLTAQQKTAYNVDLGTLIQSIIDLIGMIGGNIVG